MYQMPLIDYLNALKWECLDLSANNLVSLARSYLNEAH